MTGTNYRAGKIGSRLLSSAGALFLTLSTSKNSLYVPINKLKPLPSPPPILLPRASPELGLCSSIALLCGRRDPFVSQMLFIFVHNLLELRKINDQVRVVVVTASTASTRLLLKLGTQSGGIGIGCGQTNCLQGRHEFGIVNFAIPIGINTVKDAL
mmetsp:Transcript_21263/g.40364  ORF Transcript_21263/g.40364 Transcript_21263/m.40364 type:complete len:156 (-) Transcript_21263:901-1368(-)